MLASERKLFASQDGHGIDAGGSASGDQVGDESDQENAKRGDAVCNTVKDRQLARNAAKDPLQA